MKKIYLLFVFCAVGFMAQAGPYFFGLNQLNDLLKKIDDPIQKSDETTFASLPAVTATNKADNPGWEKVKGVDWNENNRVYVNYLQGDNYIGIKSIDWSNYNYTQTNSTTISLVQPTLAQINAAITADLGAFGNNPNKDQIQTNDLQWLQTLNFSGNDFKNIEITGNDLMILQTVNLLNNINLSNLTISGCPKLNILTVNHSTAMVNVANNRLPFSQLNNFEVASANYTYAPQGIIYKTFPAGAVDLSAEYQFGSDITTFDWEAGVTPISATNGLFVFDNSYIGQTITVILHNTNVKFTALEPAGLEYHITIGPKQIATAYELDDLRKNEYSDYILTADIDLGTYMNNISNDGWFPINNFTGTLDGNGHVIKGFKIGREQDNVGFFDNISGALDIKNLGIIISNNKTVSSKGKDNVGAFVGHSTSTSTLSISDSFVNGDLDTKKDDNTWGKHVGAFVGTAEGNTTIHDVYAIGNLTGKDNTGGIIGQFNGASAVLNLSNVYTVATIGKEGSAAGILGSANNGTHVVSNCVTVSPQITGNYPSGDKRIVGYVRSSTNTTMTNNFAWANTTVNGAVINDGAADNQNGLNKTASELHNKSTYATNLSWDFNNVWTMGNGNYQLPVLKSFAPGNQPSGYLTYLAYAAIWKAEAASTDWTATDNWQYAQLPASNLALIVNKNTTGVYPVVPASTIVASLKLQAGAEIADQHNLTVTGTTDVEYAVTAGRWNMLSVPFAAKSGDFHFNDAPQAWLKKFTPSNNEAGWEYINSLDENLPAGTGFAYWIETGNDKTFSVSGSALSNSVEETLVFGNDAGLQSNFALAGNPFLTSIDFDVLVSKNPGVIGNSYLVWTGAGFAGYNPNGNWGISGSNMDKNIAPLQSFIVEKGAGTNKLQFEVADIQVTGLGVLKVTAETTNKLNIVASNNTASVSTFIAERETGASSRKLFAAASNVPDVYTLDGATALGANIIHSNNLTIPLGLNTDFAGEITFTLSGMDTYNANIVLIDNLLSPEGIDITDLATYSYPFENSASGKTENRFAIQLSPKTPTVIKPVDNNRVIDVRYYNLQGVEISVGARFIAPTQGGVIIKKTVYESGAVSVSKIISK